jgi:outer membrane receptor protein involved in Fe transport
MCHWKTTLLAFSATGAFMAAAGSVWADDTMQVASDAAQVDDIVVTAQRRPEAEVKVPVAVTVVGGAALAERRIHGFGDLAPLVPGLTVQSKSAADSTLVLRGISNGDGSSYQEPRVSVFQDGAPMAKALGAFVELYDLERVEVVRGPQTTLFGRSALTCAINIIQNKAEAEDSYLGRAEWGGGGHRLAEAVVNAALTDTLALRLSGRLREEGGPTANLLDGGRYGDARVEAGRVTLSWRPNTAVASHLILNAERTTGSGQTFKSATFLPSLASGETLGDLSIYTGATLAAGTGFDGGKGLGLDRRIDSLLWLTTWAVTPEVSLTSTTSLRRFKSYEAYDYDGFVFPLLTVGDDSFGRQATQEFRLNYDPSARLSLVAGVSLVGEKGAQRIPLQVDERLVLGLLTGRLDRRNPVLAPLSDYTGQGVVAAQLRGLASARGGNLTQAQSLAIAANLRSDHREGYRDTSKSTGADVYADVAWTPIDRLQLTAGVRYGWLDRRVGLSSDVEGRSVLAGFLGALGQPAAQRQGLFAALSVPNASTLPRSAAYPIPRFGLRAQPTPTGETQFATLDDAGAAWRLVARYSVTPTSSLYLSYARGRRPELLSPDTPARPEGAVVFNSVAAETIDSYELGAKATWPSRGLRGGVALYRYDYRHFQTIVQQGAMFVASDAGRASATGAEADLRWRATNGAEAFGVVELSDARFKDGLYSGNRLALNSDVKLTVGANLRWAAPGGAVQFTPTYAWRSGFYFSDNNGNPALTTGAFVAPIDFMPRQKAYGLLDAALDYIPSIGGWSAGVFARNALAQDYVTDAGNGGQDFGLPTYTRGPKRMFGVRLSVYR